MTAMTPEGRKRLMLREGVRTKAYRDSVGVWTIGVGHTSAAGAPKVTPGLTITVAEADVIFARDLRQYEAAVAKAITVPLMDHQRDALISLCFNIGTAGFLRSTLVKRINAKASAASIRAAFLMWNKPAVIIGRRTSEADQFQTPYRVAAAPQKPVVASPAPKVPAGPVAVPGAPVAPKSGGLFGPIIDRLRAAYPVKA